MKNTMTKKLGWEPIKNLEEFYKLKVEAGLFCNDAGLIF